MPLTLYFTSIVKSCCPVLVAIRKKVSYLHKYSLANTQVLARTHTSVGEPQFSLSIIDHSPTRNYNLFRYYISECDQCSVSLPYKVFALDILRFYISFVATIPGVYQSSIFEFKTPSSINSSCSLLQNKYRCWLRNQTVN